MICSGKVSPENCLSIIVGGSTRIFEEYWHYAIYYGDFRFLYLCMNVLKVSFRDGTVDTACR